MTVTLTFSPEVEAGLLAKAQARGMDLQEYLQAIVEQEAARGMLEFGEGYRLSLDDPITRELLLEGHRF